MYYLDILYTYEIGLPSMVVQAFNLSTEQVNLCEIQANQGYKIRQE